MERDFGIASYHRTGRTVANCRANIPLKKSTYTLAIQILLGGN